MGVNDHFLLQKIIYKKVRQKRRHLTDKCVEQIKRQPHKQKKNN